MNVIQPTLGKVPCNNIETLLTSNSSAFSIFPLMFSSFGCSLEEVERKKSGSRGERRKVGGSGQTGRGKGERAGGMSFRDYK